MLDPALAVKRHKIEIFVTVRSQGQGPSHLLNFTIDSTRARKLTTMFWAAILIDQLSPLMIKYNL